jgi:hypothetical protein
MMCHLRWHLLIQQLQRIVTSMAMICNGETKSVLVEFSQGVDFWITRDHKNVRKIGRPNTIFATVSTSTQNISRRFKSMEGIWFKCGGRIFSVLVQARSSFLQISMPTRHTALKAFLHTREPIDEAYLERAHV